MLSGFKCATQEMELPAPVNSTREQGAPGLGRPGVYGETVCEPTGSHEQGLDGPGNS
jgi:hypothetical protein